MHRNPSVSSHQFAMVPRADIPRSQFRMQKTLKTTFDCAQLIPIMCEEVLPGDTFRVKATLFGRLSTPIFPVMDNLHLETFFFFVPNRLTWSNWQKFMGEQNAPGDSISFTIPTITSPASGYAILGLYDYFGLPTVGQVFAGASVTHSALPMRAYGLIFNQWFRDENLTTPVTVATNDGPDTFSNYTIKQRQKRHDYFTSALPFAQKSATAVGLPLTGDALVRTAVTDNTGMTGSNPAGTTIGMKLRFSSGGALPTLDRTIGMTNPSTGFINLGSTAGVTHGSGVLYPTNLYADLSTATAATINQLRQAFQIQKLLERDARGGTRYTEILRAHFGVVSPDARLQRPEFLGGGHSSITINPVPNTGGTGASGTTSPQGNLAAFGTVLGHNHGFSQSFTEHGYIIGIVSVRADLTYQQGMRRHWSRSTRYDFYFPAFAMLGEQAILSKELYCDGQAADTDVFGYQERWAEYRYNPSEITGLFRSTSAGTIDAWHLAQRFTSRPLLNATFINDQTQTQVQRALAVGAAAGGQQIIMDAFFDMVVARPLPLYSVPGLIDHF